MRVRTHPATTPLTSAALTDPGSRARAPVPEPASANLAGRKRCRRDRGRPPRIPREDRPLRSYSEVGSSLAH